uniref:Uncharacterized protein n=1 Tax=Rhizophora mucronata TaxID=61149 RepID=A0A2P2QQJ5_RHIMU
MPCAFGASRLCKTSPPSISPSSWPAVSLISSWPRILQRSPSIHRLEQKLGPPPPLLPLRIHRAPALPKPGHQERQETIGGNLRPSSNLFATDNNQWEVPCFVE